MGIYRKQWDCCDSVTETDSWEPEHCPFCINDADRIHQDSQRYRWLLEHGSNFIHNEAYIMLSARTKSGRDILRANEAPGMLDDEIGRRMARYVTKQNRCTLPE